MARLKGKVCLITGAGSGIGQASARLFAKERGTVVVADIDLRAAKATVAGIIKAKGKAVAEQVDVTDEAQCVALAQPVIKRLKRIDVLFNNAGISGVGDVLETSPELFDRVMTVNVRGVYLMSRAVVPHMIKQRSGSIVNMSSCIAEIGLARRVSYAASKGAVLAMTKSMQVDVAPHGIRVNALLPGTILTPFVERYLKDSYKDPEEGYASIRQRHLTSERCKPDDFAYAAQRVAECGAGWIADGDVVKPRRSGRWRRAAFRLPGVEPEVMVVSAGGQEQGVRHAEHDVEPEDVHVEMMDAVDVSRLQMHVSDVDARRDRSRAALARRDAR